jgi:molybdenum cofactor biosynthesis enzyme MoaA
MQWTHGEGMDLTLIETMPLGEIGEDRTTSTCRSARCGRA